MQWGGSRAGQIKEGQGLAGGKEQLSLDAVGEAGQGGAEEAEKSEEGQGRVKRAGARSM